MLRTRSTHAHECAACVRGRLCACRWLESPRAHSNAVLHMRSFPQPNGRIAGGPAPLQRAMTLHCLSPSPLRALEPSRLERSPCDSSCRANSHQLILEHSTAGCQLGNTCRHAQVRVKVVPPSPFGAARRAAPRSNRCLLPAFSSLKALEPRIRSFWRIVSPILRVATICR